MNRIQYIMLFFFAGILLLAGCKKNDPNEGLASPRIFKPGALSVKTSDTGAVITWAVPLLATGQPLTYTAEFSLDSTFATTAFTLQADTLTVSISESQVTIRKKYYVRVKANAYKDQPESKWVTGSFTITGEQLFLPVRDVELNETSVTLRWKNEDGLTAIVLATKGNAAVSYPLQAADLTARAKLLTGLIPDSTYTAELFMGTKSKGLLTFKTPAATVYSVILNSGDDIAAAITAAADKAVIGLNPGSYSAGTVNYTLLQKTVTLKSVSDNPADTKVNFKEFTLRGNGAGINLYGLELDGAAAGALYFINLTGVAADAEKAAFTQITVDNCIVHNAATSFIRANRGANAGDYTMNQIVVKNALVYDVATNLSYNCFHLDKLLLNSMQVSQSTFYNVGQALASTSTVLAAAPVIRFDYCTFNNLGAQSKYVLMDANANPVIFSITNSVIGNVPRTSGAVQGAAIRAGGAGTALTFSNNNTFNFTNGSGTALTMPTSGITQVGNQTINLGWTATTTDFTLPENSVLRTISSAGGAIGDPRWTY